MPEWICKINPPSIVTDIWLQSSETDAGDQISYEKSGWNEMKVCRAFVSTIFAFCVFWTVDPAAAQQKAFPQAEGFGAYANGGRGGDVYHVTTLVDANSPGTLRYGIDTAPTTGRTIVFDVGGWIDLNSELGIVNGKRNITIAGQTAPGDGIGVRGDEFSIGGDHIVIRHMRFRPGRAAGRVDALGANSDAQHIMLDHISAGFAYDENFSTAANDLTLQHSSVSFGLVDHSAGSLIEQAYRLSFHHNLYAHNHTRNPKARVNETIDWLDSVVYDYNNGFIAGDSDTTGYFWTANVDGNSFITGPGDTGRPMIKDGRSWNYGLYFGTNAYDNDGDGQHDARLYAGNGINGNGLENVVTGTYSWSAAPYTTPTIWRSASPEAAYHRVLSQFGATPWNRDEVDLLLVNNVSNRTGNLIERESDLVGVGDGGFGTLPGGTAAVDTDRDGIPDAWELKHGTPVNVANNNEDFDGDGYTDLEEYLNDLAAFPAPGPVMFQNSGRYAASTSWNNDWEPSRVDEVHINQGVAVVDAVGQNAGSIRLMPGTGATSRLTISDGWLEVAGDVQIGGNGGNAQVLMTNGTLAAQHLQFDTEGMFAFLGGTLQVASIDGNLNNWGGTMAPGRLATPDHRQLVIEGDYVQQPNGRLQIDLAGTTPGIEHDQVQVFGNVIINGQLQIDTESGYAEPVGRGDLDTYLLMIAQDIQGQFAAIAFNAESLHEGANYVGAGQAATDGLFRIVNVDATALTLTNYLALPGDANGDMIVDGQDFIIWNDFKFATGTDWTKGDFNGDGVTDGVDFTIWNDHKFTSVNTTAIPEPSLSCLIWVFAVGFAGLASRRSAHKRHL